MDLHVSLVERQDLAGEIYRQLRTLILDGRLGEGDRLPPSRDLASGLSVSRTTVSVAYDRLMSEGFVTSRVGAGTFVNGNCEPRRSGMKGRPGALRARPPWDEVALPTTLWLPAPFDLRSGIPDAQLFPYETWRRLMVRELRASAVGHGAYADPAGHRGLRDAIARHIGISRGVVASGDEVIVTNGAQQAVDLVARVLLAPGDRVVVEDPGYGPPRRLFATLGAKVVGVPVDAEGLIVDAIPRNTRLVYVTPSHQYPLGVSMSLARRMALLAWAERNDGAIIEDDYDSEFRFVGRPIEPLQTLDRSGRVVYVGTFSKTMLATLRIGFVVAPASVSHAIQAAKFLTDWHTALPTQAALARFIDDGWFARHVRRMREVYRARHQRVVATLTTRFADELEVVASSVGMHVCATARKATVDQIAAVVRRAAARGVACHPLSMFASGRQLRSGLVLGYGGIATEDIDEGLARLRACFAG
jgi:GntR family transcriptional regulator/MocR family aminotransferase